MACLIPAVSKPLSLKLQHQIADLACDWKNEGYRIPPQTLLKNYGLAFCPSSNIIAVLSELHKITVMLQLKLKKSLLRRFSEFSAILPGLPSN